MARVLLSRILQIAKDSDPRISQISQEFKAYKETGELGSLIGRDVDIYTPLSARQTELMHVHLYPGRNMVRGVAIRQHHRTSDIFLIYCPGLVDPNTYCLIDIIWSDAHEKLRDEKYIRNELVPVATRFREAF